MKKTLAYVLYYGCIIAALVLIYLVGNYASNLAFSGLQPSLGIGLLGLLGAVGLVVAAVMIKAKFKI